MEPCTVTRSALKTKQATKFEIVLSTLENKLIVFSCACDAMHVLSVDKIAPFSHFSCDFGKNEIKTAQCSHKISFLATIFRELLK